MGNIYHNQGKLKEALSHFNEALEIYETLEDSTNIKEINKIIKELKK